jgi:D-erythrose 4-phosphate dehydrogenase
MDEHDCCPRPGKPRPLRLAINRYGRIGRCLLRALDEFLLKHAFRVAAMNEPSSLESIAHLSRFDSTHGVLPGNVELGAGCLRIDGEVIAVSHALYT